MDDSGEIDILERQVSLLQELLRNLDRRRAAPPADPSSPTPAGSGPRAGLHLVPAVADRAASGAAETARKPRFREKRRWDLSATPGPGENAEPDGDELPAPQGGTREEDGPRRAGGPAPPADPMVPWKVYQQLLRQRDDLLVQLSHHQSAEARLMEERAAGERKDQEIRRLRDQLRTSERREFEELVGHLRRRLQVAEELESRLLDRAAPPRAGPGPVAAAAGSKRVRLQDHAVTILTTAQPSGPCYAFAQLRTGDDARLLRVFQAIAPGEREAELECLDRSLRYLEGAERPPRGSATEERVEVRGCPIHVLCDRDDEGSYQAFPLIVEPDGIRIPVRFHIEEPVTAPTPEEAARRCIDLLEEHMPPVEPRTQ